MEELIRFNYDKVFESFHAPIRQIHSLLESTTEIYPSAAEQAARITRLSAMPCSFALIVDTTIDRMTPVPGISFPFASSFLTDKQFCRHIHPSYLAPFLIFARFAYELALQAQVKREDIFRSSYRIPVPLKLKSEKEYTWYVQHGYALSVNQANRVVSHINFYQIDRKCIPLGHGEIENRFVEASIIQENNLSDIFHQRLKEQINIYLASLFQKQYKHWKIVQLLKLNPGMSAQSLADALNLSPETIKSYNKDILQKLKSYLGYQYTSLREAIKSLSEMGYI